MKKYQSILSLSPTQFSVGLLEAREKIKEFKKMKDKKLKKLILKKEIPVVLGFKKKLYLVDHHHFALACWELGIKKVKVNIVADLSKKNYSFKRFWQVMAQNDWAYLKDQFGKGPHNPLYLPEDIRGLADDPYRSLVWVIEHEGACKNPEIPFWEFKWAEFFRRRKLLHTEGRAGFKKAAKKALKLARSPLAKNLPGYIKPNKQN